MNWNLKFVISKFKNVFLTTQNLRKKEKKAGRVGNVSTMASIAEKSWYW